MTRARITRSCYESLAAWRHAVRSFLAFSEAAARSAGLTPQQHQALLAVKGFSGPHPVSVGELARKLLVRHHSAGGLVDRLVQRGLLRRVPSRADGRRVNLHLTVRGERLIERLSTVHLRELRQLRPELCQMLESIAKD